MQIPGGQKTGFLTSFRRAFSSRGSRQSCPPSPPESVSILTPPGQIVEVKSQPGAAGPSTPPQSGFDFPPTPDPTPPQLRRTRIESPGLQTPRLPNLTSSQPGLTSKKEAFDSTGWSSQQDKSPPKSNRLETSEKTRAGAPSPQDHNAPKGQMLQGVQARNILSEISRLQRGTLPLPKVKEQLERKLPHDQYEELCNWIENNAEDELRQYWNTELQ